MRSQEEIQKMHDLMSAILEDRALQHKLGLFDAMAISSFTHHITVLCWALGHGTSIENTMEVVRKIISKVGYDIVDYKLISDNKSIINSKPHLN